jgi:1,2-diacylglycerol 3-beta-glucosyltransferase
VTLPFDGLPPGWVAFFGTAMVLILAMLLWSALLFVRGQQARTRAPQADPHGQDDFLWVFVVPALNEEVTIRDSVERLLAIQLRRRIILVVDDGSEDQTPEILRGLAQPDLHVLRREPPQARQGKAAALNHAYRVLGGLIGDVDRLEVIIVVIDADGRLDAAAPQYAAANFRDPAVGGVQSLVRIYNRQRLLTWLQDVEFSVYGHLYQAGRNAWGTAGMGGNGQFNRLRALDTIADHSGPWRDRLTEDQDLGLRLILAGWKSRQELRAVVDQQGLTAIGPLLRQRTRWAQGNLQAIGLAGPLRRAPLPRSARVEQFAYLLMPFWQGFIGLTLVAAITLAVTRTAPFWAGGPWWQLAFFYLLGFVTTMLGCIASRADEGPVGWIKGILIAQIYAFYCWLLWPVLARATMRQLTEQKDWAKTEREPLNPVEDEPLTPVEDEPLNPVGSGAGATGADRVLCGATPDDR